MGAASPKSLYSPGNGRIAFGAALRLGIAGKSRYRGKKFLSFLRLREVPKGFLVQSEFWQFCMHEILLNVDSNQSLSPNGTGLKLYPRSLRWITFGAAQVLSITGTCLERGAKCVSLLSAGKIPNGFLIQSEFR